MRSWSDDDGRGAFKQLLAYLSAAPAKAREVCALGRALYTSIIPNRLLAKAKQHALARERPGSLQWLEPRSACSHCRSSAAEPGNARQGFLPSQPWFWV